jgi:hypothetical protein
MDILLHTMPFILGFAAGAFLALKYEVKVKASAAEEIQKLHHESETQVNEKLRSANLILSNMRAGVKVLTNESHKLSSAARVELRKFEAILKL